MKKRLTALLLGAVMAVSAVAPAFAADDAVEKLLPSIKARAGISDEYTDFSSDYSENNGYTEYRFNWSDDDGNAVFVGYNSDDVITSYTCYKSGDAGYSGDVSLPKISLAEARAAAQAFVDKLNPDRKGEFVVEDSDGGGALNYDYRFDVKRIVNGIQVYGDMGNVRVSREDGSVSDVYLNYTPAEFADISNKISADAAKKAYAEKLGTELVYMSYSDDDKIVMFPAYVEKTPDKYIDALTGEVFEVPEIDKYGMTNDAAAPMAESQSASGGSSADKGLSKVEEAELDKIAGLISKADIEARIRANETLAIPEGIALGSISLGRDYYDKDSYTYSLTFIGENFGAGVSADAKTGEITDFWRYDRSNNSIEETELSEEDRRAAEDKVFEALAGSVKSEYKYIEDGVNAGTYTRIVNGVKVLGDTISISVDNSGRLTYYGRRYSKVEFPSVSGAMSAEDAADKMLDAAGYDVKYLTYNTKNGYASQPVYMINDYSPMANPFTGELVNYRNEPYENETAELVYSDIDGHYAEERIKTLADYGIGFTGGAFKPDEKITQKDFLYLLSKTFGLYAEYADNDGIYSVAARRGILEADKRADDTPLTRETAAIMTVRMMGAEKYAKLEGIYTTPFDDVKNNIGYIAILYGMKVIEGDDNGHFNPENNMTRAEAACMIYRYLTR